MKTLILLAFLCLWAPLWAQEPMQIPYCGTGVKKPCKTLVYYKETKSFEDAEQTCKRKQGHLAPVHSQTDNDLIHALIMSKKKDKPRAWIGGYRTHKNGLFYWTDGSLLVYKNWHRGEPNNYGGNENCLEINYKDADGKWNDNNCAVKQPFVCATYET